MGKESGVGWEQLTEMVSQTETGVMNLSFHVSLAAWMLRWKRQRVRSTREMV